MSACGERERQFRVGVREGTHVGDVEEVRVEAVHVHEAHDAERVRDELPCEEGEEEDEEQEREAGEPVRVRQR